MVKVSGDNFKEFLVAFYVIRLSHFKSTNSRINANDKSGNQSKKLSEMTDLELQQLGYKRYSDGSIRDKHGQ